ncbi:hypothetical protein MAR_029825 [Mya arenaria]|uniref:Uncharacterized protein n=1 Tax=Mya arenaria TaxID=6604 RepID=A0ABY7DLC1_MYAAR|nr:hypothetical protein MAR_029825 [Mya arenaria]
MVVEIYWNESLINIKNCAIDVLMSKQGVHLNQSELFVIDIKKKISFKILILPSQKASKTVFNLAL